MGYVISAVDGTLARRDRFERVATEIYEPLQRFAKRRSSADVADDVVADTLLVLWRRLDEVAAGDELLWSYGVARRVLANHRRSATRKLRLVDRLISKTPPQSMEALQDSGGSESEDHSALHAAIATLADTDREVLTLWAWEGLEPRDMAIVLDISANAASIRLHRARENLRKELDRRKDPAAAGQSTVGHTENA